MPQVRKDWRKDYQREVIFGQFWEEKKSNQKVPREDLCSFQDALYTTSGSPRSESAINRYIQNLWEIKRKERIEKSLYVPEEEAKVVLLKDAIKEYNEFNKPSYGKSWQRQLTKHLDFWLKRLGNIPIDEITQKQAIKVRDSLKCSNAFKNRHFAALSSLLTACVVDHDFLEYNPLHNLKKKHRLPENESAGIALTIEQLKVLRREAENIFVIDVNDKESKQSLLKDKNKDFYLLILMALYTGARTKAELTKLKWDDYDGNKVIFKKTKNKTDRVCPVFGEVKSMLDDTVDKRGKIFMYVDYRRKWDKLTERTNLGQFTFHHLRHSTITFLLENNVPHTTVAEIVGHNSHKMIQRYNQINPKHLLESLKTLEKQMKGQGRDN